VDYVAFYEKPFLIFDRILHSYLAYAPAGLKNVSDGDSALDSRANGCFRQRLELVCAA
jgi:hypothetical protein